MVASTQTVAAAPTTSHRVFGLQVSRTKTIVYVSMQLGLSLLILLAAMANAAKA